MTPILLDKSNKLSCTHCIPIAKRGTLAIEVNVGRTDHFHSIE